MSISTSQSIRGSLGRIKVGVRSYQSNRLARENMELLYSGLERIVNVGNSLSQYLELAKTYESFWPLDTIDPDIGFKTQQSGLIRWVPAAHGVFLVFRNYLRRVWVSDRESLENGHLDILLGLDLNFADRPEREFWFYKQREINEAWANLRELHPLIGVGT